MEDKGKKTFVQKVYLFAVETVATVMFLFIALWIVSSCYYSIQVKRANLAEIHARTEVLTQHKE